MPDDTVTTSWKRSTDKVRTPGGTSVHRSLAETSRTLRQESHYDPSGQAATLAAWEDEGGTTVFAE
jgi:hypothetical protein